MTYALLALNDAGDVLDAISRGVDSDAALAKNLALSDERRGAALKLLVATGYLSNDSSRYSIRVPVLTGKDKAMVDAVQKLSQSIMSAWLQENYAHMKEQLNGLSPHTERSTVCPRI